tara:strand:- start:612 stop:1085 length:474 start_codon:yes stop_codon:yes gene_type:complete
MGGGASIPDPIGAPQEVTETKMEEAKETMGGNPLSRRVSAFRQGFNPQLAYQQYPPTAQTSRPRMQSATVIQPTAVGAYVPPRGERPADVTHTLPNDREFGRISQRIVPFHSFADQEEIRVYLNRRNNLRSYYNLLRGQNPRATEQQILDDMRSQNF